MNKSLVLSVGAYDRFNYGDLLFPIVVDHILKDASNQLEIRHASIRAADFTPVAGKKSDKLADVYRLDFNQYQNVFFLMSGGDIFCADLADLELDYLQNSISFFLYRSVRYLTKNKFFNILLSKCYGLKTYYPYTFPCLAIDGKKSFFLVNSVGVGKGIQNMSSDFALMSKKLLENSLYCAVRNDIRNHSQHYPKTISAPDSVHIINSIWNKDILQSFLPTNLKNKKYFIFQINRKTLKQENIEVILKGLEEISSKENLIPVFLPIGKVISHGDLQCLTEISKKYNKENIIIDTNNLQEMTAILAYSCGYIGSSLHGAIVSISYSVPFLSVSAHANKLNSYLKTWTNECPISYSFTENLSQRFHLAISTPLEKRVNLNKKLTELAAQSTGKIRELVLKQSNIS